MARIQIHQSQKGARLGFVRDTLRALRLGSFIMSYGAICTVSSTLPQRTPGLVEGGSMAYHLDVWL